MTSAVDKYNVYDKFLLLGDFNISEDDEVLADFMSDLDSKCLIKEPTCFKSNENPSKIDLFITNSSLSFQNTCAIDTGLSDFHRMIVTVMKNTIPKSKPREIQYRNLKKIDKDTFEESLRRKLLELTDKNYEDFERIVLAELDTAAPVKTKKVRANNKPFMTKEICKAIMTTSRLENNYRREKTEESKDAYKKQKNYTNKLCKKGKKKFLENLDFSDRKQVKQFWKIVGPFFTDKGNENDITTIVHNEKIINDSQEIADTFNEFFEKAVENLGIVENTSLLTDASDITDSVEKALKKFEKHPSILKIKTSIPNTRKFEFQNVSVEDMQIEIHACTEAGSPR